ncbi:MAG: hypothetical protein Tsb0020_32890 [Haliangiales bacterium]
MTASARAAPAQKSNKSKDAEPSDQAGAHSGAGDELVLEYDLAALPSSQHRAGLVGLVLMCHWLNEQAQHALRGTCSVEECSARTLRLRLDRAGLASLLDQVYGAAFEDRAYPRPFKNKEPDRIETRTEKNPKTQKEKEVTDYIYKVVVPDGSYRGDWGAERDDPWLKLWRDMVWSILRGVPATRKPFELRADNADLAAGGDGADKDDSGAAQNAIDDETDQLFAQLRRADAVVDLPSTYYLGAQAKTAENVRFRDQARQQLLLHFWPLVVQIYIPVTLDIDGKRSYHGYALAVPDVSDLQRFCKRLPKAMRRRPAELAGYVPKGAVVTLAVESALDLFAQLTTRLEDSEQHAVRMDKLVYGVDIFHVKKDGNNIRMLGNERIDVTWAAQTDRYLLLREWYQSTRFLQQRLINFFAERPWYAGFERIFAEVPWKQTIGSTWFCRDIRQAFDKEKQLTMSSDDSDTLAADAGEETAATATAPLDDNSIESLLYKLAGRYLAARLKSKYDLEWERAKADKAQKELYEKHKKKLAKDAFLAIRARTGDEFRAYFAGTLFSEPQRLKPDAYVTLARALMDEPEKVRILTMLALSARA